LWLYLCQDVVFWPALIWCAAGVLLMPFSTAGWDERRGYLLVVLLPGFAGLAGSLWRERRIVMLLHTGRVVGGRVEGFVHRAGGRHASPVRLAYSFTDNRGVQREGLSIWLLPADRRQFATWGPVVVIFDPARPRRHEPDIFGLRRKGAAESE